jgi:hypothetical protein
VLLLKKLKKKKRKHKFWVDIFLNWRQERDIFYSVVSDTLSIHLIRVRCRLIEASTAGRALLSVIKSSMSKSLAEALEVTGTATESFCNPSGSEAMLPVKSRFR